MLNPFPIQFLSMLAYLLLRLFISGILVYLGVTHLKHRNELKRALTLPWFPHGAFATYALAISEIVIGLFIFAGAFTQYAAIAAMIMSSKIIFTRQWFDHPAIPSKIFYILFFGASLALFITGAGALAVDLPI